MNPRIIAALLPPLIILGSIFWVIENYGKTILIAAIAIFVIFILWLIIHSTNSRNKYSAEGIESDLQWDLYISIQGNNFDEANRLLAKGANPFACFRKEKSPSCTNAKNCYEFAQEDSSKKKFLILFDAIKKPK